MLNMAWSAFCFRMLLTVDCCIGSSQQTLASAVPASQVLYAWTGVQMLLMVLRRRHLLLTIGAARRRDAVSQTVSE